MDHIQKKQKQKLSGILNKREAMIIRNKRTGEKIELSYDEFKEKFDKDVKISLDSFRKTERSKILYRYKTDNIIESDYFFNLRYNFNNFGNAVWYIERI